MNEVKKRKWFLPKPFVIVAAACLVPAIIFFILACCTGGSLYDQQAAEIWQGKGTLNYSQISVYLGRGTGYGKAGLMDMYAGIDEKLEADSIVSPSENPDARLWIYSASAEGSVSVSRGNASASATASAVTGDFFRFHSLDMMSGQVLKADEASKDIVLLDWETAWRLFGGYELEGMQVEIGGYKCVVGGVFRKSEDDTSEYRIYMSYELYERINSSAEFSTLEFVLPNPVSGYAMQTVTDLLTVKEADYVNVENTDRFSLGKLFSSVKNLGDTIAQTKSIALPPWENRARLTQLKGAIFLILAMVFAILPAVGVLWALGKLYRKRAAFRPWVKERFSRKEDSQGAPESGDNPEMERHGQNNEA